MTTPLKISNHSDAIHNHAPAYKYPTTLSLRTAADNCVRDFKTAGKLQDYINALDAASLRAVAAGEALPSPIRASVRHWKNDVILQGGMLHHRGRRLLSVEEFAGALLTLPDMDASALVSHANTRYAGLSLNLVESWFHTRKQLVGPDAHTEKENEGLGMKRRRTKTQDGGGDVPVKRLKDSDASSNLPSASSTRTKDLVMPTEILPHASDLSAQTSISKSVPAVPQHERMSVKFLVSDASLLEGTMSVSDFLGSCEWAYEKYARIAIGRSGVVEARDVGGWY